LSTATVEKLIYICLSTFTDLLVEKPIVINWKIRNNNNTLIHNTCRLHKVIDITQQDNNFTKRSLKNKEIVKEIIVEINKYTKSINKYKCATIIY